MLSISCLLASLNMFLALTAALIISPDLTLSQNPSDNNLEPAPLLFSTSAGPNPAADTGTTNAPTPKHYTVIPLDPTSVTLVHSSILANAVKDSVQTITAKNRAKFQYVLYWSFDATDELAQKLEQTLGPTATMSEDKAVYEQVGLMQSPQFSEMNMAELNMTNNENEPPPVPVNANARQRNPADDLRVVSWPPGKTFDQAKGYVYSVDWRAAPTIYIIDTGVDTTSEDFRFGIDKWLYSNTVKVKRKNTPTDDNPRSHGSCVLSKAIGDTNGVYKNIIGRRDKNSKIVVFKMDEKLSIGQVFEAFNSVLVDIQDGRGAQPAVVIFPSAVRANANDPQHAPIKLVIQEIFQQGGVVVVPSGNHALDAGRQNVDSLPALWEGPGFPLIVVGAVDNAGIRAGISQGPTHVTVYAPGVAARCAKRYGFWTPTGTSASTGSVAGLAAYVLALGQVDHVRSITTPINVKNWILTQANWIRQPQSGLRVIWNREQGY